jgi:hypothetical protein
MRILTPDQLKLAEKLDNFMQEKAQAEYSDKDTACAFIFLLLMMIADNLHEKDELSLVNLLRQVNVTLHSTIACIALVDGEEIIEKVKEQPPNNATKH